MPFKLNISDKGKSWKLESTSENLMGKKLGDIMHGKDVSEDLEGYELKITGASDTSGFPHKPGLQGAETKHLILNYGWGMHKRPRKEGKKKRVSPDGLRLRKTIRGQQLSEKTAQINIMVLKHGSKLLAEIFPDQNKTKEKAPEAVAQ